jgi:thioredoxin-related protein
MKSLVAIALIALSLSGCSSTGSTAASRNAASLMSEDEKHRLYSAALAASESPLDTDTFKDVCQKIGIFDAQGQPNDQYMVFVSQHVDWGMKSETEQFRREIDSKDKAREYIKEHLSIRLR